MRFVLILACAAVLAGCQLIYKLPTRQGNVIEQKQLDQLAVGMTREQAQYLLGTPLAASPFNQDRWDYVSYYKSPRGQETKRVVTLYFDAAGTLTRIEGVKNALSDAASETSAIKKELDDARRSETRENPDVPDHSAQAP